MIQRHILRSYFSLWLVLLGLFVAGCRPKPSTNPKAPKESYNFSKSQVENRRYVSTLNVPVDITFAEIERQLNTQIPDLIYEDGNFDEGDDLICKVWKRGTLTSAGDGMSGFRLGVPLRVWLRVRYRVLGLVTEKETEFEVNVRLRTSFGIDPDWRAHTQTLIEGYEWVSKPVMKLGPVNIPVTGLVERALKTNQSTIEKGIDAAVREQMNLKPYVVQGWNAALQPYLLSQQYRTWLKITPLEILMTPFVAQADRVRATIGIRAYTESMFGDRPAVTPVTTVPDLKPAVRISDEFKVGLVAELSHAEARRIATDTLVGRRFEFQNGQYVVEITSIDLYGSNDKLIVMAGLKGDVNGHVYFKGVPTYDPKSKTVFLDQFEYDLETRSLLVRTANYLLQGRFTRQMQEAMTFPVGEQIDEARKQVQALLTHKTVAKGVVLNGQLTEIAPDRVYLTPQSILAVVFAKGKAGLSVDGL